MFDPVLFCIGFIIGYVGYDLYKSWRDK